MFSNYSLYSRFFLGLFILSSLLLTKGYAQVQSGPAQYSGTGCPAGTVSTVFSPDGATFSVIFDSFIVSSQNRSVDRRDCGILVPLLIPENMSLVIDQADFRGFVNLPAQTRADLQSAVALSKRLSDGSMTRGIPMGVSQSVSGPLQTEYLVSSRIRNNKNAFPCGGEIFLRINSSILVQGQGATATLDTVDGAGNIIYHTKLVQCQ